MSALTIYKDLYCISTDKDRLDLTCIHRFLSEESYWSKGIPLKTCRAAAEHSLNFGLYCEAQQIGYARVISDYATVAYLGDVFVLPAFRSRGLSKWLLQTIIAHPDLQGLRRWILLTGDAHELYRQFGWTAIAHPEKWMELHNSQVYKND